MNTSTALIDKYPWLDAYDNAYLYIVGPCSEECRLQFKGELPFDIPEGWYSFIEQMCEEVAQYLEQAGWKPEDYHIAQIKEKWGELRWYDEGHPEGMHDIIRKYETLSIHTCCECGKPAKYLTKGYVLPYCEECMPKFAKEHMKYIELK